MFPFSRGGRLKQQLVSAHNKEKSDQQAVTNICKASFESTSSLEGSQRTKLLCDLYDKTDSLEACFSDIDPKVCKVDIDEQGLDNTINVQDALDGAKGEKWKTAMQNEIAALTQNQTWTLVNPPIN